MANNEKFIDKKVNLSCLLIALVLTVLAIFAYTQTITPLEYAGVKSDISTEEILDIFETVTNDQTGEAIIALVPVFVALIIISIMSIFGIIALINVIRLVIGFFGFIGSKDSCKMARKLANHAKITFGTMGIAITIQVIASMDDGKLAPSATGLFILTGIAVVLTYLAVRYYRWFVVEKLEITEWVFTFLKDVFYFVFPIFLFGFIGTESLADFVSSFSLFGILEESSSASSVQELIAQLFEKMLLSLTELMLAFAMLDVVRRTIKYIPFDNYGKPASKKINAKYTRLFILPLMMIIVTPIVLSLVLYETLEISYVKDYVLNNFALVAKLILAAIAVHVVAIAGGEDRFSDIKLAAKKEPVAAAAETVEAPVADEE